MTSTNGYIPNVSEETQQALIRLMDDFNNGRISATTFEEQAATLAEECGYKVSVNSNATDTVGKLFNFTETIAEKDDDYAVERTIELADKTQSVISDETTTTKETLS